MTITASWETVPPEIWFTIFAQLPVKNQVSLACTCKKLYRLSLDPLLNNLQQRAWAYLEVSEDSFKSFMFNQQKRVGNEFLTKKSLPDLLAKGITILRIPAPRFKDVSFILSEDLSDKYIETQGRVLHQEIKRMSNLRTLIVESGHERCFLTEAGVHEILQQKNLDEVKVPGSFLTYRSSTGKTLLHLALEKRNKKLVVSLLSQLEVYLQQEGKDLTTTLFKELNVRDKRGHTPLKIAIERGGEELCLLLLKKGARGAEYCLSQDNPDFSPVIKNSIEKGSHLQIENLPSTSFSEFFEAVKTSRHFMSLGLSESFYQELKREDLDKRVLFFAELADALKANREGNCKILDLRACLELTSQEIRPLFSCLGLEELWLPPPLLQHLDASQQNLFHVLVQENSPSLKIARSLMAQGVALSAKDQSGQTPLQLAQRLGGTTGNNEIALFLEQAARYKLHKIAFGKKDWEKYYGKVDKEPSLPDQILEILESPCPIWPGKKVAETHLLTLIPAKVNGKSLTLNHLKELVQNPKRGGNKTDYKIYLDEAKKAQGSKSSGLSYWVLMTKDVLPNTRNRSYERQLTELNKLAAKAPKIEGLGEYKTPKALEAATSILMEYVRSGVRLYPAPEIRNKTELYLPPKNGILTFTHCEETVPPGWPLAVGGLDASGISVCVGYWDTEESGLGAVRKCFGT